MWENKGSIVFENLINSIQFLEPSETSTTGSCQISTDLTYGFAEDNPIRVGGDAFDGPPRERAFLDNLLGPNGETLTYERKGSINYGDTILDEFLVTGPGVNATLYIDEYSYEALQAPVGFTCRGEFSITAP